jgi:hypothetical protein
MLPPKIVSGTSTLRYLFLAMQWLPPVKSALCRVLFVNYFFNLPYNSFQDLFTNRTVEPLPQLTVISRPEKIPAPPAPPVEAAFQNAFDQIKLHSVYPFMLDILRSDILSQKLPDDQKGKNYFRTCLEKSVALGETLELLNLLSQNPTLPGPELLALRDRSRIYYFQMLHQIELALAISQKRLAVGCRIGRLSLTEGTDEKSRAKVIESRTKMLRAHEAQIAHLTPPHLALKNELRMPASDPIIISQLNTAALEKMMPPLDTTFQGRILILAPHIHQMGKYSSYDAIAVGCSKEQFRFYRPAQEFKEYTQKTLFLEELLVQIRAAPVDSKIQFSF